MSLYDCVFSCWNTFTTKGILWIYQGPIMLTVVVSLAHSFHVTLGCIKRCMLSGAETLLVRWNQTKLKFCLPLGCLEAFGNSFVLTCVPKSFVDNSFSLLCVFVSNLHRRSGRLSKQNNNLLRLFWQSYGSL